MADSIFDYNQNVNKARAASLGVTLLTGEAAFLEAEKKPLRRDLGETTFNVGDRIEIPSEINDQFMAMPITVIKGQPVNTVVRCLCKVTDAAGVVHAKELFIGTIRKSVMNVETKLAVSAKGTAHDLIAKCVMESEAWKLLLGKTLIVKDSVTVPIMRRSFTQGTPDRPSNTAILTIDVEETPAA